MGSTPHIAPRILAAFERLDHAFERMDMALAAQSEKVSRSDFEKLKRELSVLRDDNLSLSDELQKFEDGEHEKDWHALQNRLEKVQEEYDVLNAENDELKSIQQNLKDRLEKVIGNVEAVLEEG